MKIAIVAKNSNILPTPETATWAPGIIMWNQARVLTKLNIDVRVYCAKGSQVDGEIVDFDMPAFNDVTSDLDTVQVSIRRPYYNNVYQLKVIENLRQNPVDIIHLHDFRDYPLYKEANLNVPIVVTLHGDFFLNFGKVPEVLKPDVNAIPIIAIGEISEIPEGITPPIAVIPNILDLSRFNLITKPKNRMLYVSRLIQEKGPDTAIEAARLANVNIGLYGAIFKDKDWESSINELLQNSPHATYYGHLPHSDIEQAFDGKALLLPLREAEGFPSVVIESMVSGTPVIAYALSGVRNLIKDGVNGFLVEPGNLGAMVKAIKRIDEINRARCREYTLEQYDELVIGEKLIETFRRVIEEFKKIHRK